MVLNSLPNLQITNLGGIAHSQVIELKILTGTQSRNEQVLKILIIQFVVCWVPDIHSMQHIVVD